MSDDGLKSASAALAESPPDASQSAFRRALCDWDLISLLLMALVVVVADCGASWDGRHATVRFEAFGLLLVPFTGLVLGAAMLARFYQRELDDGFFEAAGRLVCGLIMCGAIFLYPLFDNRNDRRLLAFQKTVEAQVPAEQLQEWAKQVLTTNSPTKPLQYTLPSYLQNIAGFRHPPRVQADHDHRSITLIWMDYKIVVEPARQHPGASESEWKPGIYFGLVIR